MEKRISTGPVDLDHIGKNDRRRPHRAISHLPAGAVPGIIARAKIPPIELARTLEAMIGDYQRTRAAIDKRKGMRPSERAMSLAHCDTRTTHLRELLAMVKGLPL